MKFQKLDIIYIIGLVISVMGLFFQYVSNHVYLTDDLLYQLSNVLTPFIVSIFIYGGLVTIILELIFTKDYIKLVEFIKNSYRKPIMYFLTTFIIIIILSLTMNGIYGISVVYLYVISIVGYLFLKTKKYTYLVLSLYLVAIFADGTITYKIIDKVWLLIIGVIAIALLYLLYLIITMIVNYTKKTLIKRDVHDLLDFIILLLLGYYFEIGTYMKGQDIGHNEEWEVIKQPLFPLMAVMILSYTTFVLYNEYLINKKNEKL